MSVWFVIPAHARERVSHVAFAGMAWTLDTLRRNGVDAHALVLADDGNLTVAESYGLDTFRRGNRPLGRKWNDGYQYACEHGAAHVMPCGSDDWIHPALVAAMLEEQDGDAICATRSSSAVAPDGHEIALLEIPYIGGDGIRLLPRSLLSAVDFRPTSDLRDRAIDGAMQDKFAQLSRHRVPIEWTYVASNPLQIVDFKSDVNLTAYDKFAAAGYVTDTVPLDALADHYPAELVAQARDLYGVR